MAAFSRSEDAVGNLTHTELQLCKKLKCIYQHRLLLIIIAGAWVEVRGLAANLPLGVNKKRRVFFALPFPLTSGLEGSNMAREGSNKALEGSNMAWEGSNMALEGSNMVREGSNMVLFSSNF